MKGYVESAQFEQSARTYRVTHPALAVLCPTPILLKSFNAEELLARAGQALARSDTGKAPDDRKVHRVYFKELDLRLGDT